MGTVFPGPASRKPGAGGGGRDGAANGDREPVAEAGMGLRTGTGVTEGLGSRGVGSGGRAGGQSSPSYPGSTDSGDNPSSPAICSTTASCTIAPS